MPMPRSYARYEPILSDGRENGPGLSRGPENGERPMGARLVPRDEESWSVGEASEPVQPPDGKNSDQRVGGNGNRQARVGDPPAGPQTYHSADRVRRSASIGEPVGQPVQNEVVSASVAGAEPLDGPVRHRGLEPEPGDISLSKQGRGVNETVSPTQVSMQSEARPVDPMRPTLAEALFQRRHGEGPVSKAMEGPPIVRIQIGRIEVKAVHQPATAPGRKAVEVPRSSLPLDQYLRRGLRDT